MGDQATNFWKLLPAYLGDEEAMKAAKPAKKRSGKKPTGSKADFARSWHQARRKFLAMLRRPEQIDEADRLLKNWERWLRCEQLARALSGESEGPVTIDVKIEGM